MPVCRETLDEISLGETHYQLIAGTAVSEWISGLREARQALLRR